MVRSQRALKGGDLLDLMAQVICVHGALGECAIEVPLRCDDLRAERNCLVPHRRLVRIAGFTESMHYAFDF